MIEDCFLRALLLETEACFDPSRNSELKLVRNDSDAYLPNNYSLTHSVT